MDTSLFLNIPTDVQKNQNFIFWRLEDRGGKKAAKIPCAVSGKLAKVNDPVMWSSFNDVMSVLKQTDKYSGLGFVFDEVAGIAALDIDDCRGADGNFSKEALEAVTLLSSYTEISQSGKGIHVLIKGKLPPGRRRRGAFEFYDTGRYFALTGNVFQNYRELRSGAAAQAAIDKVHARFIEGDAGTDAGTLDRDATIGGGQSPPPVNTQKEPPPAFCSSLSDEEVISIAKTSRNGSKFTRLWNGDWQGNYKSQSDADLALCNILAFFTEKDKNQIDRLFRQSGLMRSKWDERRGGTTYNLITIHTSVTNTTETYAPRRSTGGQSRRNVHSRARLNRNRNPSNGRSQCRSMSLIRRTSL